MFLKKIQHGFDILNGDKKREVILINFRLFLSLEIGMENAEKGDDKEKRLHLMLDLLAPIAAICLSPIITKAAEDVDVDY